MNTQTKNKYEQIFDLIDKAGGVKLPHYKSLESGERGSIVFNIWAFLFQFIFYFYKGMWKKAISYTLISMPIVIILIFMIDEYLPNYEVYSNLVGTAIYGAIFGTRANIDLYKKNRLNQNGWI